MAIILPASSPVVIHITSPGASWLTTIVPVIIGAALALAAQWVVQIHFVPIVESRKRKEDRWERWVEELNDLLTTQLAEHAQAARFGQGLFRDLRELETESGINQSKVAESRERQARIAREATRAFEGLLSTRIKLLANRIERMNPKAQELIDFHRAMSKYRARTVIVQRPPEYDDRTEARFDAEWVKERESRAALIKQVELLEGLPHPPRASLIQRLRHPTKRSQ